MNKTITTKQIVGTGLLLALEIIFQILGNYLQFGPVNINLSLVTIVIAAALYGPLSGAILGFFNGLMAIFSPSTIAIFMPITVFGTIAACLLKTTLAGLLAGLLFKLFKNKNNLVGLILASLTVPIVNTGIFSIFALTVFRPFLESMMVANSSYMNVGTALLFGVIGWNFLFEILTTVVLSTPVGMILLRRKQEAN